MSFIIGELEEVSDCSQTAWLDSFLFDQPISLGTTSLHRFNLYNTLQHSQGIYFLRVGQFPRLRGHTLGCGAVGNCGENDA